MKRKATRTRRTVIFMRPKRRAYAELQRVWTATYATAAIAEQAKQQWESVGKID